MSTALAPRGAGADDSMAMDANKGAHRIAGAALHGTGRTTRPHIYELDMLRALTALGVVAVHVLSATIVLDGSQVEALIQHGAEATMHYTREVFMFTTALVLVYSYVGKPFNLKVFARKRGIGVVVPYAIWSVIYLLLGPHPAELGPFLARTYDALLKGDASFQLYYILLTIQFYALFPLLLWLLPALDRHGRVVLGVSCALELMILGVSYYIFPFSPAIDTPAGGWLNEYQNRIVLVYQFYFVLGALCALHLDQLRELALRHGRLILALMGATLLAFWGYYAYSVAVAGATVDHAISVLQPIIVPYSVAVIAFLWWVSCRWASGAVPGARPAGGRFWRALADASFGIYLVHPLFMTFAMTHLVPLLSSSFPVAIRVALVWLVVAVGSCTLSVALMRTPLLSRLVGRAAPLPPVAEERLRALGSMACVHGAGLRSNIGASFARLHGAGVTLRLGAARPNAADETAESAIGQGKSQGARSLRACNWRGRDEHPR